MSFYENGATEVGRIFSVLSPSAIKQEIDSVDAYVRRIDGDIQSHKARVADLLNDWHLFVEEWTTFRDGAGWFARTTGATYDKALDYRKRADAWDELIRRRGASTVPIGTTPAPAPKGDAMNAFLKLAGIGIAAYVGVNLYRAFKSSEEAK
ncbi:MAG TPA: hypothetical protein VH309_14810 [Elusimicrobiota bacterium]|nr:hypothetical protein [Elusimicrobiota bacterium]